MTSTKPLTGITLRLPGTDLSFAHKLMSILSPFSRKADDALHFTASDASFLQRIALGFADLSAPQVVFGLEGQNITIPITNTTGQNRPPKLPYRPITIDDFMDRIKDWKLARLDHVGFNL